MVTIARFCKVGLSRFLRKHAVVATFPLLLLTSLSALAQATLRKPAEPAEKKEPEIKEELTLKNGDRLTGELLNSTGTEIKFKTELAGEVTVKWDNVKELKSRRDFAVVPKYLIDARDSAKVPQGAIKIGKEGIVVSPVSTTKPETMLPPQGPKRSPVQPGRPPPQKKYRPPKSHLSSTMLPIRER